MTDTRLRRQYSDSPFAPDWARTPEKGQASAFQPPLSKQDPAFGAAASQTSAATEVDEDENGDDNLALSRPSVQELEKILWHGTDDDCRLYCLMDGFWAAGLYGRLLGCHDISWAHLFQGDVATRNVQNAPFLIALKREHKLTRWLLQKGWRQGWGIYFTVSTIKATRHYGTPPIHDKRFLPSNIDDIKLGNLLDGQEDTLWKIRRHFRKFSDVILEERGQIVDFRYYDPWVSYSYLITASAAQYQAFTSIITCLFGEAYYVSRPWEVFDAFCYRLNCPDKKITFLNGEKESSYHINFPQKKANDTPSSSPLPLTTIPASQTEDLSQLQQEKIAYILHEKLERKFKQKLDYDIFLKIREIIHYCGKYDIHRVNVLYKFTQYFILYKVLAYDLSQLPKELSNREREDFLKKLLDEKLGKSGVK